MALSVPAGHPAAGAFEIVSEGGVCVCVLGGDGGREEGGPMGEWQRKRHGISKKRVGNYLIFN